MKKNITAILAILFLMTSFLSHELYSQENRLGVSYLSLKSIKKGGIGVFYDFSNSFFNESISIGKKNLYLSDVEYLSTNYASVEEEAYTHFMWGLGGRLGGQIVSKVGASLALYYFSFNGFYSPGYSGMMANLSISVMRFSLTVTTPITNRSSFKYLDGSITYSFEGGISLSVRGMQFAEEITEASLCFGFRF